MRHFVNQRFRLTASHEKLATFDLNFYRDVILINAFVSRQPEIRQFIRVTKSMIADELKFVFT